MGGFIDEEIIQVILIFVQKIKYCCQFRNTEAHYQSI